VLTRHRKDLLLALLLPLIVLRALLPAGFMPVIEDGELRIVMCSDGLQIDTGATDDTGPSHGGDNCPFAHAAVNAPPVTTAVIAAGSLHLLLLYSFNSSELPLTTGPPRQHGARAPPISV
jgi:hypothetical protein